MDILVFLTAVQEAADGVPLREQLMKQATELAERIGFGPAIFWPEKRIANTAERLASFGAIGGEVTSLGRWAAARLRDQLAEPDEELTAAELIAYLADCDEAERDEDAWAWLDAQPDPADAARQLLTAGASMEPRLRWIAADVVELLQEEALPVWREMAAVPGMGPHAKFALFTLEAGPEPDDGEWRWLAVESAAVALAEKGTDEAVTVLWEAVGAENPVTLCDLVILADKAAEPVPAQNPDVRAQGSSMRAPGRRPLPQRPVRPVRAVVIDVVLAENLIRPGGSGCSVSAEAA
jgi:hypothetical protein